MKAFTKRWLRFQTEQHVPSQPHYAFTPRRFDHCYKIRNPIHTRRSYRAVIKATNFRRSDFRSCNYVPLKFSIKIFSFISSTILVTSRSQFRLCHHDSVDTFQECWKIFGLHLFCGYDSAKRTMHFMWRFLSADSRGLIKDLKEYGSNHNVALALQWTKTVFL